MALQSSRVILSEYCRRDPERESSTVSNELSAGETCLRGLFDKDDDDVHPLIDNAIFKACPNGMRFDTKEECKKFVREHCRTGSNPDYPWMQQIFTTLVTWKQLEQYLFPSLRDMWKTLPFRKAKPLDGAQNVFLRKGEDVESLPHADVVVGIRNRLDLPFHGGGTDQSGRSRSFLSCESTANTFRYLFHHMRCGIFVAIRDRRLVMFAPFVNKDYTNDWDGALGVKEEDLPDYYKKKEQHYRKENVIKGIHMWWANGNIICNEHQRRREHHSQYWGDHFVSPLRDLLEQACAERDVADCEFFINKRDYPQLKFNPDTLLPVEPYGFIYDKDDRDPNQDVQLKRHRYPSLTPIVSFYCSERELSENSAESTRFVMMLHVETHRDIPFPTSEDWEAATGKVFPKSFSHQIGKDGELEIEEPRDLFTEENFQKFECTWEEKQDTAFFRGTATGGGTTRETNQRLALAWLSHEWSTRNSGDKVPLLDAAIVGWNLRDKKIAGQEMRFLDPSTMPFKGGKENFTPIYQQSKFKYLIYAEGHCAACRYGFMMRLGSVILKVTSRCVADSMWYFPLLKPWVDHVPVAADLSDLEEKIRWCRDNDDKCREIASTAGKLYTQYVSRNAALDYVALLSHEINSRFMVPPSWWTPTTLLADTAPPVLERLKGIVCSKEGLCTRCKCDKEDAARRLEEAAQQELDTEESKKRKDKEHRDRIRLRVKRSKLKTQKDEDEDTEAIPDTSNSSKW